MNGSMIFSDVTGVLFQEEVRVAPIVENPEAAQFGDLQLVQSRYKTDRKWAVIKNLDAAAADTCVWVRAHIQSSRAKGMLNSFSACSIPRVDMYFIQFGCLHVSNYVFDE
jgi:hypothetical protein